jgi:hypothetical protein
MTARCRAPRVAAIAEAFDRGRGRFECSSFPAILNRSVTAVVESGRCIVEG